MFSKYDYSKDSSISEDVNPVLTLDLPQTGEKLKPYIYDCECKIDDFLNIKDDPQVASLCLSSNLGEFIKNSLDAGATKLWIKKIVVNGMLQITVSDNGSGFDKNMLKTDEHQDYATILGNNTHIESKKKQQNNQLGGHGRGLANCSKILDSYSGNLFIYNDHGACIQFSAPISKDLKSSDDLKLKYALLEEEISKKDFVTPTIKSPTKMVHINISEIGALTSSTDKHHSTSSLFARRKAQVANLKLLKDSTNDGNTNSGSSLSLNQNQE